MGDWVEGGGRREEMVREGEGCDECDGGEVVGGWGDGG